MQNKINLRLIVIGLAFTFLILIAAGVAVSLNRSKKDPAPTVTQPKPPSSQFSFNPATIDDWMQGPSNETSLALFSRDRSCFVSLEHKQGAIDEKIEVQKSKDSLIKDKYKISAEKTVLATLQIDASQTTYNLYQYSTRSTGAANQPYGGQEFGYAKLIDGYVSVSGYCNTVDELSTTITPLQAITFESTK